MKQLGANREELLREPKVNLKLLMYRGYGMSFPYSRITKENIVEQILECLNRRRQIAERSQMNVGSEERNDGIRRNLEVDFNAVMAEQQTNITSRSAQREVNRVRRENIASGFVSAFIDPNAINVDTDDDDDDDISFESVKPSIVFSFTELAEKNAEVCSICLDQETFIKTGCKHHFCDCIIKYVVKVNTELPKCPLCRTQISNLNFTEKSKYNVLNSVSAFLPKHFCFV
jgi:hypothetical protein